MELLERYLQAIGRYLPEEMREDTLAELRANLLAEMDAREEELGRTLTEADVAAILRAHGTPTLVALRYLPQQSLIGPTVFPFYILTLKRGLPLVVLVSALAHSVAYVSSTHTPMDKALLGLLGGVLSSLFFSASLITLLFAGIDYAVTRGKHKWQTFDPFKLPALSREKAAAPKSFAKRVTGLVVHCVWMAWVLSLPWKLVWHVGSGFVGINLPAGWAFAPVWHTFYVLLVAQLSLQLAAKVVALRSGEPRWLDLVADPVGIVAVAWLLHATEYLVAAGPSVNLNDLIAANQGIGIALRVVLVFSVFGLAKKIWSYFKHRHSATLLVFRRRSDQVP